MNSASPYRNTLSTLLAFLFLVAIHATAAAQQAAAPSKRAPETTSPDVVASSENEQGQASPAPAAATQPRLAYDEKRFFKDLLRDQKAIWTSPLRIKRSDAKWLVPLAATATAMFATDHRAADELGSTKDRLEVSRNVSHLGSGYATFGAAGGLYLIGRLTHNDRARETGILGLEAVIHASIVGGAFKLATNRERPNQRRSDGRFWAGGTSFPSGHAITTWALATVVAEEYRDKPLVRYGAYGLATAVSLSRFTGRNHFPSDVVVGSAFGYLIGRYVVGRHGTFGHGHSTTMISPHFNRATRSYGLNVALQF